MKALNIKSVASILKENDEWDGADEPNNRNHPIGLLDFAHEVEQKTKYLTASKDQWSKWVYREKDAFALGYIAFKDTRDHKANDDDPKYLVYSPNINNGKYSYGDRMHSAQATTIEKGVKKALTYFRPLTIPQTVTLTEYECCKGANKPTRDWHETFEKLKATVTNQLFFITSQSNALDAELKHMLNSGYEFLDKQLGEQLRDMFDARESHNDAKKNNTKKFTYVEVYESFGQNKFRCAFVDLSGYSPDVDRSSMVTYGEEDLPEEIKDKLAILTMLSNDQYVENVGYRAAENIFYLCAKT